MPPFFADDSSYGIAQIPPSSGITEFMRIFFVFCFTLFLMVTVFSRSSWAEAPQSASGISERLDRLTKQVGTMGKKQEEILKFQSDAIDEIKNLKILVHRNCGGK